MFVLLLCYFWISVECLVVVPERVNITYLDTNLVYAVSNIRRYGRRSPYYINLYGKIKYAWGNNVTVDIIFNEFLHNEYRRSFVEMHYKFCDFLNNEPFIGGMLKLAAGIQHCPISAGEYRFMNMTVPTNTFKNVFPFEKGRVDLTACSTATKKPIIQVFLEASFKQKLYG